MKSFYIFIGLLILLIALFVFDNTKQGRNTSVLQDSKINPDGVLVLKDNSKVDLNKK